MNTSAATATSTSAHSTRTAGSLRGKAALTARRICSTRSPLGQMLTTLLASATLVTAVGITAASPAQAAGTGNHDVRACFTWPSGYAYANQEVHLHRYDSTGWVRTRTQRTGSGGCTTFVDVQSQKFFYASAFYAYSTDGGWTSSYYAGDTSSTYVPAVTSTWRDRTYTVSGVAMGPYRYW